MSAKTEKEQRKKRKMNPNSLANLKMFEKGKSGNPKGNHTGTQHRDAVIRKWTSVESEFPNPITKKKERMTVRDAMTLAMIGAVIIEKNVSAFRALNEEEFGKPPQPMELTGKDGEPIKTETTIDLSGLSLDELLTLKRIKQKIGS